MKFQCAVKLDLCSHSWVEYERLCTKKLPDGIDLLNIVVLVKDDQFAIGSQLLLLC